MIARPRVAALLLAAGLSRRYGPEDKLIADHYGRPLAAHAAEAIADAGFSIRIAVVRPAAHDVHRLLRSHGFALVENPAPETGMASSLRVGAHAAAALDIDTLLICLADMPGIDAALLAALCAAYDPAAALLVSSDGTRRTPPALIGRRHFGALDALDGDMGARGLLSRAPLFTVSLEQLRDIDLPGET